MTRPIFAKVAVDSATRGYDREYDYLVPELDAGRAAAGHRALVPFGARNAERRAVILSVYEGGLNPQGREGANAHNSEGANALNSKGARAPIKQLSAVLYGEPPLRQKDLELAAKMREKYNCTWFDAFALMLPPGREKKPKKTKNGGALDAAADAAPDSATGVAPDAAMGDAPGVALGMRGARLELSGEQALALSGLARRLEAGGFYEALLHGVTGSGKTEIYMRLIQLAIGLGRCAIVLVPEISLTPQMTQRFSSFFGDVVAVFHSRLSASERRAQWLGVREGRAKIALGPRSAVFAPFADIGVIVVDEEHESSYKSEMAPRYSALDIARMRCESHGALLVYGSATPSVELYYRAAAGGCGLYVLKERANKAALPRVHVADMRAEIKNGNRSMFSASLSGALSGVLAEKKQAILFLNRRGYSTFLLCRSCGYIVSCRDCSVSFTYHREADRLVCHYCGLTAPVPAACPACGAAEIRGFGAGTERVEGEVAKLFPGSRALRMDRDTTSRKGSHSQILGAFKNGEADILIGTQMIAKGHDFPNVTLVGVLAADSILNYSDYRASERAFQLLTQAAGRSGRGGAPGRVVIQTYNPDHYSVAAAKGHDYAEFYRQEIIARRALNYPPFMNIGFIVLSGRDDGRVRDAAFLVYQSLASAARPAAQGGAGGGPGRGVAPPDGGLALLPPVRPPLAKVKERYRWRLVLKHRDASAIESLARGAADAFYGSAKSSGVDLSFDINPFSAM